MTEQVVVKLQNIELYVGKVKKVTYKVKVLYDIKRHQYNLYSNIHPYVVLPICHSDMMNYMIASASLPLVTPILIHTSFILF